MDGTRPKSRWTEIDKIMVLNQVIFEFGSDVVEDDDVVIIPSEPSQDTVPTITDYQHIPLAEDIIPEDVPTAEIAGDSLSKVPMSPRMDYRGVGTPSNSYSERFEPQRDDVSSSQLEEVRVPLDFDFDAQQDDFTDVPSDNMLTNDPQVMDMCQDQPTTEQRSTESIVENPSVPKRYSYDLRPRKPRRTAFNVSDKALKWKS
eukprot:gene4402-8759_t